MRIPSPFKTALALAALTLAAVAAPSVTPDAAVEPKPVPPVVVATAALSTLPTTDTLALGYRRDAFGSGWVDPPGPVCDTRQRVLARDLTGTTTTRYCYIASGTLRDPYSGRTITGPTRDLDIDHVVALADAWRTGASQWTPAQRAAFANDVHNLVATTASTNRSKGDQGPDEWSPVSHEGACRYAERYVNTKRLYHLAVTMQQRDALESTLATCR